MSQQSRRASPSTASTARSSSIARRGRCWPETTPCSPPASSGGRRSPPPSSRSMPTRQNASCSSTTANDVADYDDELLAELLQQLDDFGGTGFDKDTLDELLDELAPAALGDDEPPPLPEEPETRPGA